jgi:uncharacterized membrane protein
MTNLQILKANLTESGLDLLTNEEAFMIRGGGKSKKSGKSKKKSRKSNKGGGYHGGGYGGGYGGNYGCFGH